MFGDFFFHCQIRWPPKAKTRKEENNLFRAFFFSYFVWLLPNADDDYRALGRVTAEKNKSNPPVPIRFILILTEDIDEKPYFWQQSAHEPKSGIVGVGHTFVKRETFLREIYAPCALINSLESRQNITIDRYGRSPEIGRLGASIRCNDAVARIVQK